VHRAAAAGHVGLCKAGAGGSRSCKPKGSLIIWLGALVAKGVQLIGKAIVTSPQESKIHCLSSDRYMEIPIKTSSTKGIRGVIVPVGREDDPIPANFHEADDVLGELYCEFADLEPGIRELRTDHAFEGILTVVTVFTSHRRRCG
jgi:hypothetical protein